MAVVFSGIALLALLLHGMLPHHHHTAETENCNQEIAVSEHHHDSDHQYSPDTEVSDCCQDGTPVETHVCTLNITASKQVSINLLAVIKILFFNFKISGKQIHFLPDSHPFIASNLPELNSLRGPPLA